MIRNGTGERMRRGRSFVNLLARAPARAALIAAAIALSSRQAGADVRVLRDEVVDPRGTTMASSATYGRAINGLSFQGNALTSFKGYQYTIYYVTDAATAPAAHVAVARRKLPDGAWQVIDLPDSPFKNGVRTGTNEPFDAHNSASIGICPNDGTIHLSYDHHNHPLRYCRSAVGAASDPDGTKWDASIFEPERSNLVDGKTIDRVSYPDFQRTPTGDLQLFMRRGGSGRGSWWIWDYDAATHAWTRGWQYDDGFAGAYDAFDPPSTTRCAYPNGFNYGPDGTLHISFTWREGTGAATRPTSGCNHDICYVSSRDGGRTWTNNAGDLVGDQDAAGGPLRFDVATKGLVVVPVTQFESMINEQAQAVDSAGQFHALMYRLDPAKGVPKPGGPVWRTQDSTYAHLWRGPDGTWHEARVPAVVGTRPKLVFDQADDAYAVFTNGPTPGIRANDRQLVVATATKASGWTDWRVALTRPGQIVGEPLIDNARMASEGVLSVFLQDAPTAERQPTPIRIVDFAVTR